MFCILHTLFNDYGVQENYCTSLISPSTHTPTHTSTTPPPPTHTAPSPPTVAGPPGEVFAGQRTQLNCSSSVSNVLTLRWVRVGRLTLPSSATQVGNNLVFINPQSTDTGTYSCTLTPDVSANITISFLTPPILTPPTEGSLFQLPAYNNYIIIGGDVNEVVIAVSVVGGIGVIVIILLFILILLVCTRRKPSYSWHPNQTAYNCKSLTKYSVCFIH